MKTLLTAILTLNLALLAISPPGLPATIQVPGDFPTIQQGIDNALNGDTVLVAPGTYKEGVSFLGKAVTVMSQDGPEATWIDPGSWKSAVTFENGETKDAVLQGFTLTNGRNNDGGGGIRCIGASPTIQDNCIVDNNLGAYLKHSGAGIFCKDSFMVLEGNLVSGNGTDSLTNRGGGIFCEGGAPVLKNNRFEKNRAILGGGAYVLDAAAAISRNTFCKNESRFGGGIYCEGNPSAAIKNNTITSNLVTGPMDGGGGIYCKHSSPVISNNLIALNLGDLKEETMGGGISCYGTAHPVIAGNLILSNTAYRGGGIGLSFGAEPTLINNTVAGNTAGFWGGGLFAVEDCHFEVVNTIFWSDTAPNANEICLAWVGPPNTCSMTISHSDVEGGKLGVHVDPNCSMNWGAGMIEADPLFVDTADLDCHIRYDSPCRDAGDLSVPGLPDEDFEGDPRIAYGKADMGADEFHTHLYWTGDSAPGGNVQVKLVGLPGTSPAGLFIGSDVMDPPIPSMWGDWYLSFPIGGPIDLGAIPSPEGVLAVAGTIPATPPPSIPLQALVGAELTNVVDLFPE
jgi:hypothetical protein